MWLKQDPESHNLIFKHQDYNPKLLGMKNYEILNTYGKRQSIDNSKEITQILELSDKD